MIRKYLICGKKQLYLQSKNIEAYQEVGRVVELLMPIKDFWQLQDMIKDVNYLIASGEPQTEVVASYKKVLQGSARFAVKEMDRLWLYGRKT